jgi:mevalonate kinase
LPLKKPIPIVLGNTGITASTTEVVSDVKKAKEANPEKFKKIFDEYLQIANNAKKAIANYDLNELGKLMNQNHKLLIEIGVGRKESEQIVSIAHENGALGAKITGTGRGGLVIAIAQDEATQNKIASAIEKAGYSTIKTLLGKK